MIHPVILAGGTGTRLWPLSRELNPKQFLRLTDDHQSMLQLTVDRLSGLETEAPLIVCQDEHRFLAAEHLRQKGYDHPRILLEPCGRNTAPALALAALECLESLPDGDADPLLLVLAADHDIADIEAFQDSVRQAERLARAGRLVTFGITPTHPETGYGYIQRGKPFPEGGFELARFVEKPDAETAGAYLASGEYLWNSGMFLFPARQLLSELAAHAPQILEACTAAMAHRTTDMDFIRVAPDAFEASPSLSIDYAVMERTNAGAVVPMTAGWSDVGSWSALWQIAKRDDQGNSLRGDALAEDTKNTLIHADSRLVATLGVSDLVVVETPDAVLIAHRERAQDIGKLAKRLSASQRNEARNHREVCRPWGFYDAIDQGHRYQVKRITVKPGAKLSLQMHHHRAEHWVVVSGTAKVTNGDRTYLVTENQSTFIPVGQTHCLENPGVIDLELIEVQSGPYLGEDDIVRFEDSYGRS
ncbi:mannose-1-phosphate guanylyltransferase/mannose-6-phosphate isomerase [Marinobacter sp. C2H3]|uniref:mannose-1-phosphate guanylyltransferase/mannose-6-phosphate isomerase n=1 Tax=Marinobacter sp. C2H3 TaxID=3119003 RepID=UPI00300F1D01